MLRHYRCASSHQLISLTGLGILLSTTVLWIGLVWVGWTLIFSANEQAVVDANSGKPADMLARIYFTGYTLFTLGLGDYKPQGAVWQAATAIAAGSGFFLVSLIITYLVPVISAATQKRQLAGYISSLGKTPTDIILTAWNGKNFGLLEQHLLSLTPMILLNGQRHLTYPVLHYFHSASRYTAATLSIAVLDETLTLLKYGVKPTNQIDAVTLYAVRQAMLVFLDTLISDFIEPDTFAPPMPTLDRLRASGVPTVSDEEFDYALANLSKRRRLLLALVKSHGWNWDDVYSARTASFSSSSEYPKRT
ncbi:two pore domain potassium channel family protein [Aliterella atlantica]|nr:two pore domain potassium channel family protein [Aliterella atlantica]